MMQFDSLWVNVRLATMVGRNRYGEISGGAIGVRGKKISWVGSSEDLQRMRKRSSYKIYDLQNKWITPGLIDCHTHLIFAGNRAHEFTLRQEGATYEEIAKLGNGIMSTVRATRMASEQELFNSAAKRLRRLLSEGVTTVEIKSGYGLDFVTELKMLRVATKLKDTIPVKIQRVFLGAHAIPPEYKNNPDTYIDFICNTMLPEIKKKDLADAVDAYCETIAFTKKQIEKLFTYAKKYGFSLKIHAEQLSNQGGAKLIAAFSGLSADHLEYAEEDDISALKKSGAVATVLPGAYFFLNKAKKPPIDLLKKYDVPIAIATDLNPGTSPINSLLTICAMACILFGFTPEEALQGVTVNAAKALGLENEIGTLEAGKQADFVAWNIESPDELSYGIGMPFERLVVSNGEVVYDTLITPKNANK